MEATESCTAQIVHIRSKAYNRSAAPQRVNMLYGLLYDLLSKKSTTNRSSGVWARHGLLFHRLRARFHWFTLSPRTRHERRASLCPLIAVRSIVTSNLNLIVLISYRRNICCTQCFHICCTYCFCSLLFFLFEILRYNTIDDLHWKTDRQAASLI